MMMMLTPSLKLIDVVCDPPALCLAGSVHALSPQGRHHPLHCLLHVWQHMRFVQVSVQNTLKSAAYFTL